MTTQTGKVIYLPAGVSAVPVPPAASPTAGLPFDRAFFEGVLPAAVASFRQQLSCDSPVVEVLTVDGTTHYVKGISGVSDLWVALTTVAEDHEPPTQSFVAYQTVFRVEIHPCGETRRHLGFVTSPPPAAIEGVSRPVAKDQK